MQKGLDDVEAFPADPVMYPTAQEAEGAGMDFMRKILGQRRRDASMEEGIVPNEDEASSVKGKDKDDVKTKKDKDCPKSELT